MSRQDDIKIKAVQYIEAFRRNQDRLLARTVDKIGLHCMRESKANAPISPTVKQVSSTLVRKRRTKQRKMPGGLERSIEYDVQMDDKGLSAHIFVARNSPAGVYANYIHNLKGVKWFKRGKGTVAKGERADEKFIERAVYDGRTIYRNALVNAIAAAIQEAR